MEAPKDVVDKREVHCYKGTKTSANNHKIEDDRNA